MALSAHFFGVAFKKIFFCLAKGIPEAWGKEFDNQPNLSSSFYSLDENFREPMKKLTLQSRQARA